MTENKNKNNAIFAVVIVVFAIAALLVLFFLNKGDDPVKQPINSGIQSEVQDETNKEEEKPELNAEFFSKPETITINFGEDITKEAEFTLGDYGNYFLYLPKDEWKTDGYDCWFLGEDTRVSLSFEKQMYIDVEKDMQCLATDYEYKQMDGYTDVMFLEEDELVSVVKVVKSGEENAVYELNYTYPAEKAEYANMWEPIFNTFEVFDIAHKM